MTVTFTTGQNYADGKDLLSPLLQEITDQADSQSGIDSEIEKYSVIKESPLTPDGIITAKVGPTPLTKIDEDESIPLKNMLQGYEKGYKLDSYAGKYKVTKEFRKWVEKGAQIQGADSSVLNSLNKFKTGIEDLADGKSLTINEQIAQVYAKGFAITESYGPGSASPDGVSLFNASHVVKKDSTTWSNLVTGALTSTTLQSALDLHKTGIKMDNGYRVKTADVYKLLVPRALEQEARTILNSNSDQAGMFAGTGTNANLLNSFSFNGNKVELVVVDMLGQPGADGTTIGSDTMWFVLNPKLAGSLKAFRMFTLWDAEFKMYDNDDTGSTFVKTDCHFVVDHYSPQAIVGSTGL